MESTKVFILLSSLSEYKKNIHRTRNKKVESYPIYSVKDKGKVIVTFTNFTACSNSQT